MRTVKDKVGWAGPEGGKATGLHEATERWGPETHSSCDSARSCSCPSPSAPPDTGFGICTCRHEAILTAPPHSGANLWRGVKTAQEPGRSAPSLAARHLPATAPRAEHQGHRGNEGTGCPQAHRPHASPVPTAPKAATRGLRRKLQISRVSSCSGLLPQTTAPAHPASNGQTSQTTQMSSCCLHRKMAEYIFFFSFSKNKTKPHSAST